VRALLKREEKKKSRAARNSDEQGRLYDLSDLQERGEQLRDSGPRLRKCLLDGGLIKRATKAKPSLLAAVDAADAVQTLGEDQASILIQTVTVEDDGYTTQSPIRRITGMAGEELTLAKTPMRVAREVDMTPGCN
jgi:hypothetical protein